MDIKTFYIELVVVCFAFLCCCSSSILITDDDEDDSPWNRCPWIRNKLKNGKVKIRNRGRIAKFLCEPGYELVGKRFATCVRGQWNNPIPVCVARGCFKLPEVPNAQVTEMYRGAVVLYDCHPGYTLEGPSTVYCDGRHWTSVTPSCDASPNPQTSCDFEDPDLCGWTQDPTHDFDWKRNQFSTPSGHAGTGPSYDHTFGIGKGGFYLYEEASSPRKPNDMSRLFSPVYSDDQSGGCFLFWYHMYGTTVGGLKIYIKPESHVFGELDASWELFGEQGNQWIRGNVSVPKFSENFQIVIEGIRGSNYMGDTAIDDVHLTTQPCDEVGHSIENRTFTASNSCRGRCREAENTTYCGCNDDCHANGNCCYDFVTICTGNTDNENPSEEVDLSKTTVNSPNWNSTTINVELSSADSTTIQTEEITSNTVTSDEANAVSVSSSSSSNNPSAIGSSTNSLPSKTTLPVSTTSVSTTKIIATVPTIQSTATEIIPATNHQAASIIVSTTKTSTTSTQTSTTSKPSTSTSPSTPSTTTITTTTPSSSTQTSTPYVSSTTPATSFFTTISRVVTSPTLSIISSSRSPNANVTTQTMASSISLTTASPVSQTTVATSSSSTSTSTSLKTTVPSTTTSTNQSSSIPRYFTFPTPAYTTSTRKTYNLRPRNRTTVSSTTRTTSVPWYYTSRPTRTSYSYRTTRSWYTSSTTTSTQTTKDVTHPTSVAPTSVAFTTKPTIAFKSTESILVEITSVKNSISSKTPIHANEDHFASEAKSSTISTGQSTVTVVTVLVVLIACIAGSGAYIMRKRSLKRQSKLSDDSEMRFLSDSEVAEYSDPTTLDKMLVH